MGIDQSFSGLGICFINTHGEDYSYVKAFPPTKYGSGVMRLSAIQEYITGFFPDFDFPSLVCIEGYAYGSKFGREIAGELSAAIRLALIEYISEKDIITVPPKRLKKFVTDNGSASKKLMVEIANKKWNLEETDHNAVDAFGLAKIAKYLLDSNSTYNFPYEKEVIDELRKLH